MKWNVKSIFEEKLEVDRERVWFLPVTAGADLNVLEEHKMCLLLKGERPGEQDEDKTKSLFSPPQKTKLCVFADRTKFEVKLFVFPLIVCMCVKSSVLKLQKLQLIDRTMLQQFLLSEFSLKICLCVKINKNISFFVCPLSLNLTGFLNY